MFFSPSVPFHLGSKRNQKKYLYLRGSPILTHSLLLLFFSGEGKMIVCLSRYPFHIAQKESKVKNIKPFGQPLCSQTLSVGLEIAEIIWTREPSAKRHLGARHRSQEASI